VLTLIARGDLILDFEMAGEIPRVLTLSAKYADRSMDIADACVVRMAELNPRCRIWTVDRADFLVYRRNGREKLACEFPPEL
jgi:uncharacterized protein